MTERGGHWQYLQQIFELCCLSVGVSVRVLSLMCAYHFCTQFNHSTDVAQVSTSHLAPFRCQMTIPSGLIAVTHLPQQHYSQNTKFL